MLEPEPEPAFKRITNGIVPNSQIYEKHHNK